MKVSRVKIGMGVLVVAIVALVRYAMRDMQLDVDLLREGLMNMPGLVMENMQLAREVSGDVWRVRVPYLERRGELVAVRSAGNSRRAGSGISSVRRASTPTTRGRPASTASWERSRRPLESGTWRAPGCSGRRPAATSSSLAG